MTKPKENPRAFIVAYRDKFGFPKFAMPGFFDASEAAALADIDPAYEALRYSDYIQQADIDDLSERKGRAREHLAPAKPARVAVVTGTFPEPRAAVTAKLLSAGYAVRAAVTGATTHVVAGDHPGGKVKAARYYGIPVLSLPDALAAAHE
jgi:NAD-dependent DNA ligase